MNSQTELKRGMYVFGGECLNFKQFFHFCSERKLLMFIIGFVFFVTYSARLIFYSVGVDMDLYMSNGGREEFWDWYYRIGRYGYVLLQHAMDWFGAYNPVLSNWIGAFWMFVATLLWCDLFYIFSHNKLSKSLLILFGCIFITSPIWAESFYFTFQSAETSFTVALCPVIIYLYFTGISGNKKWYIILGILLFAFSISIYQVVVPFLCSGVFACLLLYIFTGENIDNKVVFRLFIRIFIYIIFSIVLYFVIYKAYMFIFPFKGSDYLTGQMSEKDGGILKSLIYFILEVYKMTIGKIPFVQEVFNPIMAAHAKGGVETVRQINASSQFGTAMLLPLFCLLMVYVIRGIRDKGYLKHLVLIPVCLIICVFFFPILARGGVAIRTYWALPLTLSFMYLFVLLQAGKKVKMIIVICAVISCIYQLRLTSQLFVSDYLCFRQSEEVARTIWNDISEFKGAINQPVVVIGKWEFNPQKRLMLSGDVLGHSPLEWSDDAIPAGGTSRVCGFMQIMGFPINNAQDEQMRLQGEKMAKDMPSYPHKGYVQQKDNFIVVKLSESHYQYK